MEMNKAKRAKRSKEGGGGGGRQRQRQEGQGEGQDGSQGRRRILIGGDAVAEIQQRLQGKQPKTQIKHLQRDTSVQGTLPLLPLIDIMGTTRAKFHQDLMARLRGTLLKRIPSMSQDDLGKLLLQTFPYVQFEELRPVTLQILNRYQKIPSKVLRHLRDHPKLLEQCSLQVKRQVWQYDDVVFAEVVQPMLHSYAVAYTRYWVQAYMTQSTALAASDAQLGTPSPTAAAGTATAPRPSASVGGRDTRVSSTRGSVSSIPTSPSLTPRSGGSTPTSATGSPTPLRRVSSTASVSGPSSGAVSPSTAASAAAAEARRKAGVAQVDDTHGGGSGGDDTGAGGGGGNGGSRGGQTGREDSTMTPAAYAAQLLELVGTSEHLHQRLLEYLRLAYVQSNDVAYCHLRMAMVTARVTRSAPRAATGTAGATASAAGSLTAAAAAGTATGGGTGVAGGTGGGGAIGGSTTTAGATGATAAVVGETMPGGGYAGSGGGATANVGSGGGGEATELPQANEDLRQVALLLEGALQANKLSSESLSQLFDTITSYKANDPDLGDVGMIVRAPGVATLLCRGVLNQLILAVDRHALPRLQQRLIKLTQILGAGYQVREMLEAQSFRWPGLALEVIQTADPLLANMLAEDVLYDEQLRRAKEKAASAKRKAGIGRSKRPDDDDEEEEEEAAKEEDEERGAHDETRKRPEAGDAAGKDGEEKTGQRKRRGGGYAGGDNESGSDAWRRSVDEKDEREVPGEIEDFGIDIYYVEVVLALYMARRAAAGDMTRVMQMVAVLCKSGDPTYALLPGVQEALQAILSQHWAEFVRRKAETIPNILVPLAGKHATLHLQVIDFLDRAPEGLEEEELKDLLMQLASKRGAVCGKVETAGPALNTALLALYRHLLQDKHLPTLARTHVLDALASRIPRQHKA